MSILEHTDKKLKCRSAGAEVHEDRQKLKKEPQRYNTENLDNYFNLARATEEKLQKMVSKVETA